MTLFRASISFNMMFLEEIWSRNFTNLFIAPIKINEIITSLTLTAVIRTLIGLIPASILAIPLFVFQYLNWALHYFFTSWFVYIWSNLGLACYFRTTKIWTIV